MNAITKNAETLQEDIKAVELDMRERVQQMEDLRRTIIEDEQRLARLRRAFRVLIADGDGPKQYSETAICESQIRGY